MNPQVVWTIDEAVAAIPATASLWCTASVRDAVRARLPLREVTALDSEIDGTLVVAGGGAMIDAAKRWRQTVTPRVTLVALPTVWGSGAEATAIAVFTDGAKKAFLVNEAMRPEARIVWPELGRDVPAVMARNACGDAWAHALEGFLSPLATDALRGELAEMIRAMSALPLAYHPGWFELSARAAAGQERSSVGLVHGIAHALEPIVAQGHASLCALALLPVLKFDLAASSTAGDKLRAHGLDPDAILAAITPLFSRDAWDAIGPALTTAWSQILRDPCTRTNVTLVRPASLDALRRVAA